MTAIKAILFCLLAFGQKPDPNLLVPPPAASPSALALPPGTVRQLENETNSQTEMICRQQMPQFVDLGNSPSTKDQGQPEPSEQ